MPDIFLFPGESNPADIRLRDPTVVDVTVDGSGEGVAASPSLGAGVIDVTFVPAGVAASPALGSGAIDVTFALTGVAANPQIGAGRVDVSFILTGIAADPHVGAGTIDVTYVTSSVAASPALGAGTFDVSFPLTGVAADPEIGAGTIEGAIDVPPAQIQLSGGWGRVRARERWLVAIVAPGVMARPQIGAGRVDVTASSAPTAVRKQKATKAAAAIIHVSFSSVPVRARELAIGQGSIDTFACPAPWVTPYASVSDVGEGFTHSVVELFEDEILALLAAA
jgi:hypothetical protein